MGDHIVAIQLRPTVTRRRDNPLVPGGNTLNHVESHLGGVEISTLELATNLPEKKKIVKIFKACK